MGRNSLRWRLPFSYAVIALFTVLALAGMLLLALDRYYVEQERRYLMGNARTIGIAMQMAETYDLPADTLQAQVETFSFFTQTRVRLFNVERSMVADSGSPLQQRALAVHYADERHVNGPPEGEIRIPSGSDSDEIPYRPLVDDNQVTLWFLLGEMANTEPAPDEEMVNVPAAAHFYGFDLGDTEFEDVPRSEQAVMIPILNEGEDLLGYVELSEGPAYGREIIRNVMRGLLVAGSAAVLLAAGVGWLISRRISAPVVALAQTSMRMTAGDLSARAEVDRHDEIGVLAHAFNEMAARMEETINALRAFVSNAAHQIHTPLTALHTDLELAMVDPDLTQRVIHLERALGQVRLFEALTSNLLDLSRIEAGIQEKRRPIDLCQLLGGLSETYASRAEQAGSALQVVLPTIPMMVEGYEMSLRQAIGNLMDNAIKFTPAGGQVQLSLSQDGSRVVIAVKDTGIGIPAEDLPHVFQRFHRGRNTINYPGSGLGLAITQSIIQAHGGTIEVQSSGQGTCFRVSIKDRLY